MSYNYNIFIAKFSNTHYEKDSLFTNQENVFKDVFNTPNIDKTIDNSNNTIAECGTVTLCE